MSDSESSLNFWAACAVSVCRILCATVGLPGDWTIGEPGNSLGDIVIPFN
ncbi:unnamed protein product [Arabidopsis halleri]